MKTHPINTLVATTVIIGALSFGSIALRAEENIDIKQQSEITLQDPFQQIAQQSDNQNNKETQNSGGDTSSSSESQKDNGSYSAQIDSLSNGNGGDVHQSDVKVDGEKSDQPVVRDSESSNIAKEGSSNAGFAVATPAAPAPPMTACMAFAGVLLLQAFRRTKAVA